MVDDEIRLDQFLKWSHAVSTGGQGKMYITEGMVKVNGEVEQKRGRRLVDGDLVEIEDDVYQVVFRPAED